MKKQLVLFCPVLEILKLWRHPYSKTVEVKNGP